MRGIIIPIVVVLLVSVGGAIGEEFYLKHDTSGKTLGPFQATPGSRVQIGKATFTVVKKSEGGSSLEQRLESIIIPTLEVRHAPVDMTIDLLRSMTLQNDPDKKGVNFVVLESGKGSTASDPFADFGSDMGPMVTLSLRQVSALEALKLITEQAKAKYTLSGNTVRIALP